MRCGRGDEKNMPRVDVILDMEPDYLMEENYTGHYKKIKKDKEKTIKIDKELFEHALREGLIEKTEDGYVFIGKYEDIKAFKKKKH